MKTDGELYLCGNSNRNKMYYLPQSGDNGKRYHIIQSMFFLGKKFTEWNFKGNFKFSEMKFCPTKSVINISNNLPVTIAPEINYL